ncbi:hypothetical protein [Burkholderia vietnamiensis]|uniref:hypothetical protein n=1 Tax=Burkholderia vietnamiensis TaxID=60552 RepID=UPI001CB4C7B0|nr:hypothetical protein [Burkholderia vietnamiensis]CAG9228842.1 conserved hypothetical protein [Burkholderia vietnamiensis]HDR9086363.1 hypothetical protein [Burkholderia vietnamiensis]
MNVYLAASDVTLTIPFVDSLGNPVTPTAVSYRVLDEEGSALVDSTSLAFDSLVGSVVVTVPAALNALPSGKVRALRQVELLMDTAAGRVFTEAQFVIEGTELLVPGTNSFQTLNKAELVALDIPGLTAWSQASRADRIAAMIQARNNIGQMQYRYRWSENWQNFIFPEFGIYSIVQFTQEQYLSLPIDFRVACERAQIMEADDLLGGDPVLAKRAQGIVSETIGDSTTAFSAVRPSRQLICDRAMKELARYVVKRTRLTRAT